MASRLPSGPILELCCGVGGLTRVLARNHKVVAVDQNYNRIIQAQANLRHLGLDANVDFICCDLANPAIKPIPGKFRIVILDPDWSASGDPPNVWTDDLTRMRPDADKIIRWAQGFRCMIIMRMPPDLAARRVDPIRLFPPLPLQILPKNKVHLDYLGFIKTVAFGGAVKLISP